MTCLLRNTPTLLFPQTRPFRLKILMPLTASGFFFGGDTTCQPIDFRKVGFHRNAGYILGVAPREPPPRLKLDAARKIAEPYARGTIGLRAGYKESVQGNETSEYYRQMNLKIRF